jgi:hypothetical protein
VRFCVPVRVGVPVGLQCEHLSHGAATKDSSGELRCEECGSSWRLEGELLTAVVEDALVREVRRWHAPGRSMSSAAEATSDPSSSST